MAEQQQQEFVPEKVFPEEKLVRYKQVFDIFDINKNGQVETKELAAVSKYLGYRLDKEQLENIVKSLNLDQKETLNFFEFLQAMPGNTEFIPEIEHLRAEYRRKFQEYDKNGDGFITRQEAQQVLEKALGFTEEKTRILILRYDINEDGKLSYEDFVGFYIKVQEKKKVIQDNFQEFDKDGKGYVSADDAKRILSELMFTDEEVTSLLEAHDTNKDGKLQYQEFVHFWGA